LAIHYVNHKVPLKDTHWTGTIRGTRNRGRPRATWKITRDWQLQKAGKRWKEAKGLALDRTQWKTLMKPCVPHRNKIR